MPLPLSAILTACLLAACSSPGPPPHSTGRPLQTRDDVAELHGPSADEVIWQATRQWHAERRRETFQRQRRY